MEDNDSAHKIAVVPVEGIISSDFLERGNYGMVDYIKDQLKMAAQDDRVTGVAEPDGVAGGHRGHTAWRRGAAAGSAGDEI